MKAERRGPNSTPLGELLTEVVHDHYKAPVYILSWISKRGLAKTERFLTMSGEAGAYARLKALRAGGVTVSIRAIFRPTFDIELVKNVDHALLGTRRMEEQSAQDANDNGVLRRLRALR